MRSQFADGARWLLILAGAAAALAAAPPAPADDKLRLGLALLRRDGILVPFAGYDDGRWTTPWPSAIGGKRPDLTIPIGLGDVPDKWWGPQGRSVPWRINRSGEPAPLQLQSLTQYHGFCELHLGLKTAYQGSTWELGAPTVPKDALAIAGDAALLPVESIDQPDERELMADRIMDEFNQQEQIASRSFMRWKHPFKAAERRTLPIKLETWYRTEVERGNTRWRVSYVEAVRTFPARSEDQGCGLITFVRGWVLQVPGHKDRFDLVARVTYCDRDEVSFIQPFGMLHLKNEWYWVMQFSSWRDETYAVSRLRPEAVIPEVLVSGGSCPKEKEDGGN